MLLAFGDSWLILPILLLAGCWVCVPAMLGHVLVWSGWPRQARLTVGLFTRRGWPLLLLAVIVYGLGVVALARVVAPDGDVVRRDLLSWMSGVLLFPG